MRFLLGQYDIFFGKKAMMASSMHVVKILEKQSLQNNRECACWSEEGVNKNRNITFSYNSVMSD